jgi:YfiH family protein
VFTEKLPRELSAREEALEKLGIAPLILANQVHGENVLYAGADYVRADGDALITDIPGVYVGVVTADCVPILLAARGKDGGCTAVAAVHAGWRGTALKIAEKAVFALQDRFGVRPENTKAFIGPCVCQSCYETGPEVSQALGPQAAPFICEKGGKHYPDLRRINALWLQNAGVREIHVSEECTCCRPDVYWSHRRHGTERGTQISAICL